MRKLIPLVAAVLALSAPVASAQPTEREPLTADKCFTAAPTTIFDLLDSNTRLDMLDYFRAGVSKPSINSMDGECMVLDEEPESLIFQGGTDTTYQIFVLNPTGLHVIGVIETINTPIPDSSVKFYNTRWQPLDDILPTPGIADWTTAKDTSDAEQALPFVMASYRYDPATGNLTMTQNMDRYFVPSDTPAVLSQIRPTLTYHWDGKKFKPVKQ